MHTFKVLRTPAGAVRLPRVLSWDIETAPNVVTAHSLFNDRGLPTSAIMREKYIICGAWKVMGEAPVHGACVTPQRPQDDRAVVKALHAALSSADAIVHHYGDKFDIPTFNARAIFYGLAPLPPIQQIDTYRIARAKFKFNSNRLDYLGHYLGLGRKLSTNYALWDDCMRGDADALARMQRYNAQDVRLLERVFLRLYPFTRYRLNVSALTGSDGCRHCGSNVKYKGDQLCRTKMHEMYQCTKCGAWLRGAVVKTA